MGRIEQGGLNLFNALPYSFDNKQRAANQKRAARVVALAQKHGIPTHRNFEYDIAEGFGIGLNTAETILEIIGTKQPGIMVQEREDQTSISLVEPSGEFTAQSYTGIPFRIELYREKDQIMSVAVNRTLPDETEIISLHMRDADPHQTDIQVTQQWGLNRAVYKDHQLTQLTYIGESDSTSKYVLNNVYDPTSGLWHSTYAPAYRDPFSIQPGEAPVLYEQQNINQNKGTIQLDAVRVTDTHGEVDIIRQEGNGRRFRITLAAPSVFPKELLPQIDYANYLDWLAQNWQEVYAFLSKQMPILADSSVQI